MLVLLEPRATDVPAYDYAYYVSQITIFTDDLQRKKEKN
jgi:hypothetical protein